VKSTGPSIFFEPPYLVIVPLPVSSGIRLFGLGAEKARGLGYDRGYMVAAVATQ
jgi:hypothetical protein